MKLRLGRPTASKLFSLNTLLRTPSSAGVRGLCFGFVEIEGSSRRFHVFPEYHLRTTLDLGTFPFRFPFP